MPESVASQLLRAGLLEGMSVLLAGVDATDRPDGSLGAASAAACAELGARVSLCSWAHAGAPDAADGAVEEAVERALAEAGGAQLLIVDGAALLAAPVAAGERTRGDGAGAALDGCLEGAWNVTRAVVNLAFLPRGEGGRIVYLAPARTAGEHAEAARAGLENLARTLSIEWARHSITAVAIAAGESTTTAEVGALSAYLASPAGAYFSGCLLDLSGPG